MRYARIVILLVLGGLAASCARRPEGVLSNRQMVRVLTDLHRTDGILQVAGYNYGHDQDAMIYYQLTLERNGVTQAEFDSSLVWYTDHPAYFQRVYPKVLKRLQKMYNEEDKRLVYIGSTVQKMMQDSIFLQTEPPKTEVVNHVLWETRRIHRKELFTPLEPLELFTAPILREMEAKKQQEEREKAEAEAAKAAEKEKKMAAKRAKATAKTL